MSDIMTDSTERSALQMTTSPLLVSNTLVCVTVTSATDLVRGKLKCVDDLRQSLALVGTLSNL